MGWLIGDGKGDCMNEVVNDPEVKKQFPAVISVFFQHFPQSPLFWRRRRRIENPETPVRKLFPSEHTVTWNAKKEQDEAYM